MVTTLIARRSQFHESRLVGDVRNGNPNFANLNQGLVHALETFGSSRRDAVAQAYARTYETIHAQAATLAYIDTFMVLCVGAAIMFFLTFALKKNDPGGGATAAE